MFFAQSTLQMGFITQQVAVAPGTAITIPGAVNLLAADVATVSAALANIPREIASRTMLGTVLNNTTTYTDVSNLTIPINRLGQYAFEYVIRYDSSDVTEGIGLRLAYTGGSVSGVRYFIEAYTDLATRANLVSASSFGSAVAPFTAGPGATQVMAKITGTCTFDGLPLGDLKCQFRAETGGAQFVEILDGSYANVWQIPS